MDSTLRSKPAPIQTLNPLNLPGCWVRLRFKFACLRIHDDLSHVALRLGLAASQLIDRSASAEFRERGLIHEP